jgi:hypothetical protein
VKNRYHIRFNTKHGSSELYWRVFENGNEILVRNLNIKVPVFDEVTYENGVEKRNICCVGNMKIINNTAVIE